VHVELQVNFDERHALLQMPIVLASAPVRWTDGIADGRVDRAPSPTEWPFLGWSRLRVGDTDIGLVTSDFYSHSVDGARWQPTLLRSPRMAWGGGNPRTYAGRDQHTDQGTHRFLFTLHLADGLTDADMAATLAEAAQPLVVFDRYEGMDRPAWGPVPPRGLWGPAMLRNVADDRITDPGRDQPGGLFSRRGHDDYAG
jgi:alpha-mannosidase